MVWDWRTAQRVSIVCEAQRAVRNVHLVITALAEWAAAHCVRLGLVVFWEALPHVPRAIGAQRLPAVAPFVQLGRPVWTPVKRPCRAEGGHFLGRGRQFARLAQRALPV